MTKWSLIFCLLFLSGKGHTQEKVKVLFIGNSLTYTNNLPAMMMEIGAQEAVEIIVEKILLPDYSLEDHWADGTAAAKIKSETFDFVIAQQGPSALPESQQLLIKFSQKFADECERRNTRFALFMVWPSRQRMFDFSNVIASYTTAAQKTASLLCPAGAAWKKAWELEPALSLYGPDGFHPGVQGSFLAALVNYGTIRHKTSFAFLDYSKLSIRDVISAGEFKTLVSAAGKTIGR